LKGLFLQNTDMGQDSLKELLYSVYSEGGGQVNGKSKEIIRVGNRDIRGAVQIRAISLKPFHNPART
jgi:hypothetical protein